MGSVKFSKCLVTCACLVALIALAIGSVRSMKPELFLRIPNVGFMVWLIVGLPIPPFLDNTPFMDNNDDFFKENDVIVSAGIKCGTNWLLNIVRQMQTKGSDDHPYIDVNVATPWIDLVHMPGDSWTQFHDKLHNTILPDDSKLRDHWDHPTFPFRVFKSHKCPIPINGGPARNPNDDVIQVRKLAKRSVKFIAMYRNPKDIVDSLFPFFSIHNDQFRTMWGGFPPIFQTKDELFDFFIKSFQSSILGYLSAWWPYRHDPNVLFLHYSNMKQDLEGNLKKIAKFVGMENEFSDEQWQTIVTRASFPWMKANKNKYHYILWGNTNNPNMTALKKSGSLIRYGVNGRGDKEFFTQKMQKKFAELLQQKWPDKQMREWALTGLNEEEIITG